MNRLFHRIAPFELVDSNEDRLQLTDFEGRYLVLYFYPKANTSGCSVEAQEFTAQREAFERLGATIVGVSPDAPKALCRFTEAKGLNITLASDPDRLLAKEFGALKENGGISRSTFLIDATGVLRTQWRGVKAAGHAADVLETLHTLHQADHQVHPAIATRRARRALSTEGIDEATITRLLEAATLAPSCFNHQPWRLVVATGETLEQVKAALPKGNAWATKAPVIVALAADRNADCKLNHGRDYFLFDVGLAVGNLMVQATQMGLIAHPIAGFDPAAVKVLLAIPESHVLINLVVLGRRGSSEELSPQQLETEQAPRQRRPLAEDAGWNRFVAPEKTAT